MPDARHAASGRTPGVPGRRWSGEGSGPGASGLALADLRRLAGPGEYRCIAASAGASRWESLDRGSAGVSA
jgi:hypothetical protein